MLRQLIVVTDPDQDIYSFDIERDAHFSLFINGYLVNEGDEFNFGPEYNQVTLLLTSEIGDTLDFRSL